MSEPVRIGVPFPKGVLYDPARLRIAGSGSNWPLQARPLGLWPDKSIKWVLLDFFASVDPNAEALYTLTCDAEKTTPASQPATPISISETSQAFVVDTGAALFTIPRSKPEILDSVLIDGIGILADPGLQLRLEDDAKNVLAARIDSVCVEESGPLRSAVRLDGKFVRSGNREFCNLRARLAFFAGLSHVALEFAIHNPRAALHPGGLWDLGDPGSIHFNDLSLVFRPVGQYREVVWSSNAVERLRCSENAVLWQDSSGGVNWNSPNHVDRNGRVAVSFKGYKILEEVLDATQAPPAFAPSCLRVEKTLETGERAEPTLKLATSSAWIATAIPDFWQNFPKALRVRNGELSIGLFPVENPFGFELQAGEKKRHTLFFDFGREDRRSDVSNLQHPLHAFIDPQWIGKSEAVSHFVPQRDDRNARYLAYIQNVIEGSNSFFEKREQIDEYGWRNFGDIYADHEAVNHIGPEKFISHYNNQYDFIYGAAVHFLRTGDARWSKLMREAALHTIDIDIYHTDEDKAAYSHGLFWHTDHYRDAGTCTHRTFTKKTLASVSAASYGGGPCNEHNYTSGLLQYYYLTGDPEARDAVLELAGWVLSTDDGANTLYGLIDSGPTGLASSTADPNYHGPGRGAGNSINALLDAYRLTGARGYFSKAEELIQRCVHPKDDLNARSLDDPERRWSYLVFFQVLGKYLDYKIELGEIDYCFHYARESLLHYARWMVENEVPYKDVLHKVDIPTETWPAQDIRKCSVMHLAAKYGPSADRQHYSERAAFFFDRCLKDLLSFDTACLTRPLVILTVCGFVHAYFQNEVRTCDAPAHAYDFGLPEEFLPQKARLKATVAARAKVCAKLLRRAVRSKF